MLDPIEAGVAKTQTPPTSSTDISALFVLVRLLARQAANEAFATRCTAETS